jgi:uncharacterized protein (TIGR00255 family)
MARQKRSPQVSQPVSMTGFGVGAAKLNGVSIEVELKAANSRFLDLQFRLPRVYGSFEADLRSEIAARVERGRVDVTVSRVDTRVLPVGVRFNREAFRAISKVYTEVGRELGAAPHEVRSAVFANVLSRPEVMELQQTQVDYEKERAAVIKACRAALNALGRMRQREGAELGRDLARRVKRLMQLRVVIGRIVARRPEAVRDRLMGAVKRLAAEVPLDEQRLHMEVALLVDRYDVTEELVRLDSHLKHFESLLATASTGKKLDFMVQELLREFNTIGSKAQEPGVQAQVVEAKSEIEKIREQVQNLE